MSNSRVVKWTSFLYLGLYVFLGFGIELVLVGLIEPGIFKVGVSEYSTVQSIMHWIATIIIWAVFAFVITRVSKKKYGFDFSTYKGEMSIKRWTYTILIMVVVVGASILSWNGFKVYKEFMNLGWLRFIFQYMYYLMESVLILLVVVFGQKAGEVKFNKSNIPWGGILVGLTWGLIHIFSQGSLSTGILSALGGFSFGVIYLLVNQDVRIAYPLIALMFIL